MPLVPVLRPNGPLIRALREARKLSLDDLARQVSDATGRPRHPQSLRNIENGNARAVGDSFLAAIADCLSVPLAGITLPREPAAEPDQDEVQPDEVAA
jgi:transcriptional regulator with XRE-family HTH domain